MYKFIRHSLLRLMQSNTTVIYINEDNIILETSQYNSTTGCCIRDCANITLAGEGAEPYVSLHEKARPSPALLIFYLDPPLDNTLLPHILK